MEGDLAEHHERVATWNPAARGEFRLLIPTLGASWSPTLGVEETQAWAEVENNQGLFLARFFLVLVSTDYSRSH